jgi:hypothetical protein
MTQWVTNNTDQWVTNNDAQWYPYDEDFVIRPDGNFITLPKEPHMFVTRNSEHIFNSKIGYHSFEIKDEIENFISDINRYNKTT